MLISHCFDWYEAVSHEEVLTGTNERLHRLTLDVLLPGPTSMEQIEVTIPEDGTSITLKYTPPVTYLSANRTAARMAVQNGAANVAQVQAALNGLRVSNRVQSHEQALIGVRKSQSKITITIPLPFPIDVFLCSRNDFGHAGADPMSIGIYRHEDPTFQANNHFVWILHIEMTDRLRNRTNTPSRAANFVNLGGVV
jgi:hypothetical protein